MFFITTKFHDILLSGFRGVALTRKTGLMDGLTAGRVKNIIPSATRCVQIAFDCYGEITVKVKFSASTFLLIIVVNRMN